MVLTLDPFQIVDNTGKYIIDFEGNFETIFLHSLQDAIDECALNEKEEFLLPLTVSFHRGEDCWLWLDWAEATKYSHWCDQLWITLSDRVFQAANEINRHTFEPEIRIVDQEKWNASLLYLINQRLKDEFKIF